MGYRFYAHHLRDFYNCDWIIGQLDPQPRVKENEKLLQVA